MNIDLNNYNNSSLKLIFSEADKQLFEVNKGIDQNINRSYFATTIYGTCLLYSALSAVNGNLIYFITFSGSVISLFLLFDNLLPSKREIRGCEPRKLIDEYFTDFSESELENEYLATLIESYSLSIENNRILISKMNDNFKYSFFVITGSVLLFAFGFICS